MIRDATPEDAAAIGAIWNPIIRDTAITFWPTPRSDAEIRDYIAAKQDAGHGVFVAESNGSVTAFAAYGQFRTGGGYAHSMEHTIYTTPAARGAGLGAALLRHLEDHARHRGARLMIGGITGSNAGSIAFHARHGYAEWGRIPAAGFKFGQWHELVLMGKDLSR
ncbi:GNAT family N-acetyltransferase [uncultured Paracoccus sp.]|uniref:GNAT family N-acetyltransferase n=1 Tax=Paracoccus sp. S1E-3 TaxID=2756130 RepID=UPI0015EF4742|nr:GNAT family N-acetyltransferase [uncultured Paracoccus sp.]MBA4489177.1 N-acetyltransferase [Paracoccus sp. S1E-3]